MLQTELPATRVTARDAGLKHYFTGKPCSKGHVAARHITGTCVECAKLAVQRWEARHPGEATRRAKRYYIANPEKVKAAAVRSWRKLAGLPEPLRPKPERCELCGRVPNKGQMHLDHCHATGVFRGWLCGCCNRALGLFRDNVTVIAKAITYLESGGKL